MTNDFQPFYDRNRDISTLFSVTEKSSQPLTRNGAIPTTPEFERPKSFLEKPLWNLDDNIMDPTKDLGTPVGWCQIGTRNALPRKGIVCISGKAKQGRSLATYALVLPLLTGKTFDTITPTQERPKRVVVFDLGMNDILLQQRLKVFYPKLGIDAFNKFGVVPLVGLDANQCYEKIMSVIKNTEPDIVIIDNISRLMENEVYDPIEATKVLRLLEYIGMNSSCWCVIDETNNSGLRGHLGALLWSSAIELYTVQKKDRIFRIKPVESTISNTEGSDEICFRYDDAKGILAGHIDLPDVFPDIQL